MAVQIPAQVVRTRLFAYKQALQDRLFQESHCACCARRKRVCKLTQVLFPPRGAPLCPTWLGWTEKQWADFGTNWYNQVEKGLDIEVYLESYFCATAKVASAQQEFNDARTADAEIWLQRVMQWQTNLRADLRADSVCAPSCDGKRWLLYLPDHVDPN